MPAPTTDVAFSLPGPEYERISWVHDEHLHGSETPLIQDMGLTAGGVARDGLPRSIFVNGYSYGRAGFDLSALAGAPIAENGIGTWRERWQPEIESASAAIEGFDPGAVAKGEWSSTLDRQAAEFREIFMRLHMETMVIVLPAAHVFLQRWTALAGAAREADGMAFLQGFANESRHRVAELWALSRLGREDPLVEAAIRQGTVPGGATATATQFGERFAAFIGRFGHTTTMHLQDLPTWAEDRSRPLTMVAAYLDQPDEADPEAGLAAQVARREALEGELSTLAASSEEARELVRILGVARNLPAVSEDHNVIGDHRLLAASRQRWLRIGAHLVGRGQLAAAADVFYLRRAELLELLEGPDARIDAALIRERRDLQALWRTAVPPGYLGARPSAEADGSQTVTGHAASSGVYRGQARVLSSLDAAESLEAGDILVVSATGPEWTGYFGLIGGLVTDVGGPLTHAGVMARELGIPAVTGTGNGTTLIPDGATIVVDGSAGTVTVEA